MKNLIIVTLLLLILSCNKGADKMFDVAPPQLQMCTYQDDEILYQFDEPVKSMSVETNEMYSTENECPKANVTVPVKVFENYKSNTVKLTATDTSDNVLQKDVESPVINKNPATVIISELQLKYSKKSNQFISVKAIKGGSTAGLKLIIYYKNIEKEFCFADEIINDNAVIKINFLNTKYTNLPINQDEKVYFSKRKFTSIYDKNLSQSLSLIYLIDYKNEIIDYLLYYDSKTYESETLYKNKTYKTYSQVLNNYGIEPIISNITGNTTKKRIFRLNNRYIVKG